MCISFDKDYKRELVGIGVEDRHPILHVYSSDYKHKQFFSGQFMEYTVSFTTT